MAEISLKNCPSDHEIYLWRLEENLSELEHIFRNECHSADALQLPKPAKRRMETMAELLLLKRHGYAELLHEEDGAPRLLDSAKQISISHCRGYVLVCLSDKPVGADIETWGDRAWKIRERFLSEKEMAFTETEENEKTALLLWCAKEAAFKYFRETDTFLTSISLSLFHKVSSSPIDATIHAISVHGKRVSLRLKEFQEFAFAITEAR